MEKREGELVFLAVIISFSLFVVGFLYKELFVISGSAFMLFTIFMKLKGDLNSV